MSNLRHRRRLERAAPDDAIVRTFGVAFEPGALVPPQALDWHQLIYASRGVMTVHTDRGSWVVPSHRAVWVPARVTYGVEMSGPVAMRTLYVKAGRARGLPRGCVVVNVSPLLRELVLHAVELGALRRDVPAHRHLARVILDQLETLAHVPLQLPMPGEPRAAAVARALEASPGTRSLGPVLRKAGASRRTVERAFAASTGMSFGRWLTRLRALHALKLLAAGEPVASVADACGYATPSAFIAMFRRELGTTPRRYFEA